MSGFGSSISTPRRLRPNLRPAESSPNLTFSSSSMARQASLSALTGGASPSPNPMADAQDIDIGDVVDVPGGMHGVVKFVGSIRGKKGVFAGVELSSAFASRGKNDGAVEGTHHLGRLPPTPTTPSYAANNFSLSTTAKPNFSPSTPSLPKSSFSQSLGPGAQRARRPSLSRPESPLRKTSNLAPPTPGRSGSVTPSHFSKSAIGAPPRFASPAPPRGAGVQKPRTPGPSRPYSRNTNSRLGQHDTIDEDGEASPNGAARTSNDSMANFKSSRLGGRPNSTPNAEVQRLNKIVQERDKQLEEQATALADMEATLAEIQSLMPEGGFEQEPAESNDVRELRSMLRDRNDKIAMLTAEFDAHRADFRSTIDTLELASTETERVYEKKVDELQAELHEMLARNEDVETVAMQLKQLEELVQELEEGLEDARRGEAEARGEVEFLRGEVERGRSELRREREKAAEVLKSANTMVDGPPPVGQRELEQRDDEIRGLKAIIHSLSSGVPEDHDRSSREDASEKLKAAQATAERLEREKEELRGLVERKAYREEELERELEKLRSQTQRESVISNAVSEHTVKQEPRSTARDSKDTVGSWRAAPPARREPPTQLEPMVESDGRSSAADSVLWCEICETGGHDILNCAAMGSDAAQREAGSHDGNDDVVEGLRNLSVSSDHARPAGLTPTKSPGNAPTTPLPIPSFNHSSSSLVPPKGAAVADPDKWCALCENEGHDVTECPNEDAF
ncbi:hypothetical protein EKO04_002140 [Ascochyta lentis]|uniref:CAP-Gly domain-containing protein n=1 Tax=Ascochyta lentis TaxID=205686 RepID=A0A8H7JBZ6_9PLEO|nr:hypothetical protein EKO04_002140 [Ascochyta lentis]